MALIEKKFVQHMILFEAADLANHRYSVEHPSIIGDIFSADPERSERGGLCLSIEPGFIVTRTREEIEELHQIGVQAVRQALVKMQDQFIGLVLGEARRGRNYFDNFVKPDEQMRMF